MALGITELRKCRDQGWHSYLRGRVRSKAGVVSKALNSQPECSFAKGVAEHEKKKPSRGTTLSLSVHRIVPYSLLLTWLQTVDGKVRRLNNLALFLLL